MPARSLIRGSGVSAEDFLAIAADPERYQAMLTDLARRKTAAEDAEGTLAKAAGEYEQLKSAVDGAQVELVAERERQIEATAAADERARRLDDREAAITARESALADRAADLEGREVRLAERREAAVAAVTGLLQ